MLVPGGYIPPASSFTNSSAEDYAQLVGMNGVPSTMSSGQAWHVDDLLQHGALSGRLEEILNMGAQSSSPAGALDQLKELAKTDPAYMELYLTMLRDKEASDEARKWYEDFNNSYYQRTSEDLKKAGLNPWLALTQGFGAGNGSIVQSGSGQGGVTSAKATQSNAQLQAGSNVLKGVLGSVLAIIGAMIIHGL